MIKIPRIKSLKNVDTNNLNAILGDCPHCKEQITTPKIFIEKEVIKGKVQYKPYPTLTKRLKDVGKRITILESQVEARKFNFEFFGREYSIWFKRHVRLEDILV